MAEPKLPQQNKNRFSLSLDYKIITIVLLAVIGLMLVLWKLWEEVPGANDRTVQVTGQAKITAQPDEFVFYPAYEFSAADKDAALTEMGRKSDEVVSRLKSIGVADNKIKTNSDGYDRKYFAPDQTGGNIYTLRLTVTVGDRDLAQKVQDYLVTTQPIGAVSPQATFSESKRKELEAKARDKATLDARAKAEQSAKNLGYRIGKVKAVSDGDGFSHIMPLDSRGVEMDASAPTAKLDLQPGENELSYSVTVTYYIK